MLSGPERRPASRLAAAAMACAALLGGCESMRFGGGRGPVATAARSPSAEPSEPVVSTVPSGSVSSTPLAPLPGSSGPPADIPPMPGSPQPVETLGSGAPSAAPAPVGTRSAAIGGWTAREAAGTSCRINLSSTPSLDLYRASASGCANKDLGRITAWDFRDGEVYLYQPGGAVAARLRPGSGSLSGVLSKSGAPLTLTRA